MEEIAMAIKTAGDVMKFAKDNKIEIVDLKFCDVPGLWQHFSVSANEFGEDVFEDGIGFDGRGRHGGASRNRYAIYDAHTHGRPGPDLQVHHQERGPQARQDGDGHAEADFSG